MATVGSLTIDLGVASASLRKGIEKAQGTINTFVKRSKREFKKLEGSAEDISGAFTNSLSIVNAEFTEITKEAKNSRVALEEFSGLASAFKVAGADVSDLTGLLSHMRDAISDASSGTGTYAEHFKKLNLNVDELKQLNPTQQFQTIATAINQLTNETDRNLAFSDLFGGAQEKIGLILGVAKGDVDGFINSLKEMNLVTKTEVLQSSADLSSSLSFLSTTFKNLIGEAFKPFTDGITKASQHITALANSFPEATKLAIKLGGAIGVVSVAIAGISLVMPIITALASPFVLIAGAITGVAVLIYHFRDDIKKVFTSVKDFTIKKWEEATKYVKTTWEDVKKSFFSIVDKIKKKWTDIIDKLTKSWNKFKNLFSGITDKIKNKFNSFADKSSETFKKWWGRLPEDTRKSLEKVGANVKTGLIDPLVKGSQEVNKFVKNEIVDPTIETTKKVTKVIEENVGNLSNSISQATKVTKDYWSDVGDTIGKKFTEKVKAGKEELDKYSQELEKIKNLVAFQSGQKKEDNFFKDMLDKETEALKGFDSFLAEQKKEEDFFNKMLKDEKKALEGFDKFNEEIIDNSLKEKTTTSFSDSVATGIISGLESGGVKGALEGFANSLKDNAKQELISGLSKALSESLGNNATSFFSNLFSGIGGVFGFNKGGVVQGSGVNRDTVPAMLTAGEIVFNPKENDLSQLGVTNIYNTYNIKAEDVQSFERKLANSKDIIYSLAEQGKRDNNMLRGG